MRNKHVFSIIGALLLLSAGIAEAQSPKFRMVVNGGYGYRPVKVAETGKEVIDTHNKKLKKGLVYGAEAAYYFSENLGIGVKYSNMRSSAKDRVVVTDDAGNSRTGMYSDVIDMSFIGPVINGYKMSWDQKHVFAFGYGIGYLGYVDDGMVIDPMSIKGWTLGQSINIGYDYRLTGKLYLGAELAGITGVLTSCEVTENGVTSNYDLADDERESLLHVYLTVGLRLYL